MRRACLFFLLPIPAFVLSCSVSVAPKSTPTIQWATPAAITYGTALGATQLDATSSVAGTFVYSPAAGTVLTAGTQTLKVTFTPTDTAEYNAATASVTLAVNPATLIVTANNASRVYGAANPTLTDTITGFVDGNTGAVVTGAAALSTTATSSSPVRTYPIAVAQGTLAAANYTFSFVNGTLTVNQATPVITWATPAPITAGTALSATQLDATSSVAGTLAYTPAAGTVLSAGQHTLSVSFTPTNNADYTTASDAVMLTVEGAGGALSITTTSCPDGQQGAAYAGCTIAAEGGTPPYSFSVSASDDYPPLPEGIALNATTGAISSAEIGGQGTYAPEIIVTDSTGATATAEISFAISGNNAFLAQIFPSTSIFHHRVDAATTGLPVDTSPAAPMYSGYLPETVKPFFGNNSGYPFPNGIPAFEVPWNQPDVAVSTTVYQSYFTSGPIPANAPVEGTSHSSGDRHVLTYLEAGGGNNPALYEMWQGIYEDGPWTDSSNALWPNVASNALTPQGMGTSDAAGLPVGPLLANADEVIGTGTPTAPNGTIQHPIRFTLNHMVNYWVWPATETAGVGYCTASDGSTIPTESEISQSSPPASCTMSGPAGEIYRLKASVPTPTCAATSPQAAIIITAFRNYGIILADNGDSGGLIGTPDARWNDDDLSCITSLTLGDFEPVNVSSLIVSNDSGATSH
jgi:MBG domain (YGX type)